VTLVNSNGITPCQTITIITYCNKTEVNDILSLLEIIDTKNSDIDHVLSKVNDIYIKAASNTMI
jgi:hypothetical protein